MFGIKEFWQIFVKYLIQRFVNEKNKDEIQVKNAQTDEDNNTRIMKALIIIRLRQAVCEQFILFETLLNDGFSTDRIIYDKIANIEAIESKLINFSKEFSMKYLIEQKRKIENASLDVLLIDILLPNIVKIASS